MSITITSEFESALESINSGRHVLISGKAGTGKSTLLRTYLESLPSENVLVTAPTGVAALNVEGFTIHKAFGFRPGMYPDDLKPGGEWHPSSQVRNVLKVIDVLVIDEISMVRADLFEMIDIALRSIRRSEQAFGGAQLVLVGDLLQLPPVVTNSESEIFSTRWESPYFFSAHCFDDLELTNITLTTVWRQTDNEFLEVLNQVREGSVGDAALKILNAHVDPNFQAPNDWVTLASHRRTVDKINQARLQELTAEKFISHAQFEDHVDSSSFSGSEELHYCVGARVMTIINDPQNRFVNGSFGSIVAATADSIQVRLDHNGEVVDLGIHTWEVKRPSISEGTLGSEVIASIKQFPVILAWAITIHKSQGKTIPKLFINLAGGTTTDGQFYVALSRGVDLENLKFSAPVEARHIRANNTLVRRIRREVSASVTASRVIFLSVDGVNFGISDHVIRIHAVIIQDGTEVANFGSWINPMSDLGEFGRTNNVPAGGLALAPTLGDFWPLLKRQAAGGIVVGDRLPMLERAVRHQEKGLDLAVGVGYDISDFEFQPQGNDVTQRCQSMAYAFQQNPFNLDRGQVVPPADQESEGAVFIPTWANNSPMKLDPARATDSDNAWAAFSGGPTTNLDQAELEETAEILSAWAISRGSWNTAQYDDVRERASKAGLQHLTIEAPVEETQNIAELLTPGTRIAFTGRNELLGVPADDDRLQELCAAKGLEYKKSVSKSRCDVLVAGDPASMSRKAQNAREFGKPIISQADFEDWYRYGPVLTTPVADPISDSPMPTQEEKSAGTKSPELAAQQWVAPADFFQPGTRVAFRGSTFVNGELYTQGESLQSLCALLGLEYKQAVTKTRSDVLVTDDPLATDGKMSLALRYEKPLMHQEDFSAWATAKLEKMAEGKIETPIDLEPAPATVVEAPVVRHHAPITTEPEKDPTPQELMQKAIDYQLESAGLQLQKSPTQFLAKPVETAPTLSPTTNTAAAKFKKWGKATGILFVLSNVIGIAGVTGLGALGVLTSLGMAVVVAIYGVKAALYKANQKQ